jgi:hypothetical protein
MAAVQPEPWLWALITTTTTTTTTTNNNNNNNKSQFSPINFLHVLATMCHPQGSYFVIS